MIVTMNRKKIGLMLSATFLLFSAAAFTGCKKEKTNETIGEGSASATLNYGNKTEQVQSSGNNAAAYLDWVEDSKKFNFALTLKDNASNKIMQMVFYPANDGTGNYTMEGLGAQSWSVMEVKLDGKNSSGDNKYGYVWVSHDGNLTMSDGTLTITSMTEKNVKGTFKATLYSYNPDTKIAKKMTVSDGKFDLPLVRRNFDFGNYDF